MTSELLKDELGHLKIVPVISVVPLSTYHFRLQQVLIIFLITTYFYHWIQEFNEFSENN